MAFWEQEALLGVVEGEAPFSDCLGPHPGSPTDGLWALPSSSSVSSSVQWG